MTVGRATVVSCRRQRGESHKRTSNLDQEHNSAGAEHVSPSNVVTRFQHFMQGSEERSMMR